MKYQKFQSLNFADMLILIQTNVTLKATRLFDKKVKLRETSEGIARADQEKVVNRPQAEKSELYNVHKIT